jgi:hypothetical protein
VAALFRSRQDQAVVELALRKQLAVYTHRHGENRELRRLATWASRTSRPAPGSPRTEREAA